MAMPSSKTSSCSNITAISNVENALKRKQTDFTTQTHANFKKTAPQLIANERRCPNNRRWHAGEQQVLNEKRPIFATSERTFETVPCFFHGDRFTQKNSRSRLESHRVGNDIRAFAIMQVGSEKSGDHSTPKRRRRCYWRHDSRKVASLSKL